MPTTAILVPCYNAATYLSELIAGIKTQTKPFDEIIFYDDASSDITAQVITQSGYRLLQGPDNRGAAWARNRLIEASIAEWIHFHDADDLISKDFVQSMVAEIRPGIGAVICSMIVMDRNSRKQVCLTDYTGLEQTHDPIDFFLRNTGYAIVGLYSRDWLKRIGGFREDIRGSEDPDLHVRLAAAGCMFKVIQVPLVTNLIHGNSFSARNRVKCSQDRLKCLEDYAETLDLRYHGIIGQEAVRIASGFHLQEIPECDFWVERGIQLARKCGFKGAGCNSKLLNGLSYLVGVRNTMRFRRWRNTKWPNAIFN